MRTWSNLFLLLELLAINCTRHRIPIIRVSPTGADTGLRVGKRIQTNISSVTRNISQEYFICDKNLRLLSFSPSYNIISLVAFFGNLECDNHIGSDSNNMSLCIFSLIQQPNCKPRNVQPRSIGHLIYLNRTMELTGSKEMAFHTSHLEKCALAVKYKRC